MSLVRWLAMLFAGILTIPANGRSFAQEQIKFERVMRPDAAVAAALEDCKALAQFNVKAPFTTRWIMLNEPLVLAFSEGEKEVQVPCSRAGLSFAANTTLLHGAISYRVFPVVEGVLYKLDLAQYVDYDEHKLGIMLDTWDRMTDNQFYLPTDETWTAKTLNFKHTDGKSYSNVYVKKVVPAAHADVNGQLTELCSLTGSKVPIISAGQFLRFTANSDFGGLYPEFRQFNLNPQGKTDEQEFLLRAGVDFKKLGDANVDQRVICVRKPTSSYGFVEYALCSNTQPNVGPVIVSITRDFFTGFIDPNKHPLENLGDRKHDGSEIFLPTPAGGLEYALFDGNGKFVRSAPLNPPNSLAWDSTIPQPFLPILQGWSGCVRCHIYKNPMTKAYGIYQPAPNYVSWLRDVNVRGHRFDVLANKGDAGKGLARLVSLFKGETDRPFSFAGRTYANFAFEASGLPLEQCSKAALTIHDNWLYRYITPRTALLTLGYKVEDDLKAVELFNTICPPAPEPLRVTQLRAWKLDEAGQMRELPLTIDDFLAVYPEIALRVQAWEQSNQALPAEKVNDESPMSPQTP